MFRQNPLLGLIATLFALTVPASRVAGQSTPSSQEGSFLDQPFPHDADYFTEDPCSVIWDFLRETTLAGGVILLTDCGDAPAVQWKAKRGSSFRQVLNDFQAHNPAYRWELHGNVLNLVPVAGIPRLLVARIKSFDLQTTDQQTTASSAVGMLLQLPEIQQAATDLHIRGGLYEGPRAVMLGSSGARNSPPKAPHLPISIQLNDLSLQDAINAVAQAYGHTWWRYTERSEGGEVTYTIEGPQTY